MAISASSWGIGTSANQGPVRVDYFSRQRHLVVSLRGSSRDDGTVIAMDILLGKAVLRRVGDPSPTLRNIFNRFFELIKADRYEVTIKNEALWLEDKVRKTKTQIMVGDGVIVKLPTKCSFYVLGKLAGQYHSFESIFSTWTLNYERDRQNAAQAVAQPASEQRAEIPF